MLTVRTVDESARPVQGARVAIYSDVYGKNKVVQNTKADGLASGKLRAFGSLFFAAGKDGYYSCNGEYHFDSSTRSLLRGQRWTPWNPTVEALLKKKGQPIAMYVKRISIVAPENGVAGFDLEIGDWVPPHGRGKVSDVAYESVGRIENGTYRLTWRFLNLADGIQAVARQSGGARSELRSPKEAPTANYAPTISLNEALCVVSADGQVTETPACFVFRVRSVVDENSNVVSSRYGKIYPGSDFRVTYYLNPTANSRNLECDLRRNLFPATTEGYNDP